MTSSEKTLAFTPDRQGRTPLMAACRDGDLAKVELLISQGADVNARNNNGTTPFMYAKTAAFGSGSFAILNMLLAAGADPFAQDNFGKTALDYTVERSAQLIAFLQETQAGVKK